MAMPYSVVIILFNLQLEYVYLDPTYRAYKIEELVRFEFSNFIFVRSQVMMSQNGLFDHAQYSTNPKNEEFETITQKNTEEKVSTHYLLQFIHEILVTFHANF